MFTDVKKVGEDNPYSALRVVAGEPDSCDVEVTVGASVIFIFHATRLQLSRRKLEGLVAVDWRTIAGIDRRTAGLPMGLLPATNIDWRSNSSLETLRKRMQDYFDPEKTLGFPFMPVVQWATQRVQEFISQAGDLEIADYVDAVAPDYLVKPIWPNRGTTVWFGQGETCKGQMYIGAAVSMCYGLNVAGLSTKDMAKGLVVVDYEDDYGEFSTRVSRVCNGLDVAVPPSLKRFDPRGRLFVDIADQLKLKIAQQGGAAAIIVDSALPATGGDAKDPEPVGAFFNALSWLGVPALVIAHETKDGNDDFPFGSQLWRTSARMNVNFQAGEEKETPDGKFQREVLLRCTKANNVRRFRPLAFNLTFTDDESPGALPARTWIRQVDPMTVGPELYGKLLPLQRMMAFLKDNPEQSVADISTATGLPGNVAYKLLSRNPSVFEMEGGGRGRGNAATWKVLNGTTGTV